MKYLLNCIARRLQNWSDTARATRNELIDILLCTKVVVMKWYCLLVIIKCIVSGQNLIEVSKLDGSHRMILISRDLDEPRAVVVHPAIGSVIVQCLMELF